MNDRKRAWQVVHNEILRRSTTDTTHDDTRLAQIDAILAEVDDEYDMVMQLAGFAATFALMHRDPASARRLADQIGARVMQEPDDAE
ncbi:hypothetical protein ACPCIR_16745 [Mycobacterium sp. NPDC051198]